MSLCAKCSNSDLLQTQWEELQPIGEEPKVVHSWLKAEFSPDCALCQLVENETEAVWQFGEEFHTLTRFIYYYHNLKLLSLKDEASLTYEMVTTLGQDHPRSENGRHDGLDPQPSSAPFAAQYEASGRDAPPYPIEGISPDSDGRDNPARPGDQNPKEIQSLNVKRPAPADILVGRLWHRVKHFLALKKSDLKVKGPAMADIPERSLWHQIYRLFDLMQSGMILDQHLVARTVASMEKYLSRHEESQNCVVCNSMEDLLVSGEFDFDQLKYNIAVATQSEKRITIKNHSPPLESPRHVLRYGRPDIEKVEFVLEKREHWSAIRLQELRRGEKELRVGPTSSLPSMSLNRSGQLQDCQRSPEESADQSLSASSTPALTKEWVSDAKDVCVLAPFKEGKLGSARQVTKHVDVEVIRLWLNCCGSKHILCSQQNNEAYTPGLILIDTEKMCLIPVAPGNSMRYIALSYVWGSISQPTLTKAVLETWACDGQLRDLEVPQTVHDAIKLVQMIGYRYMWVDALCIVQDDSASRHEQISQMHEIYRHADMTIVAAAGNNCAEGLPGVTRGNDRVYKHRRYQLPGLSLMKVPSSIKHGVERSLWRTRGWTFQEELCSRRTLVLLPEVMFFSCASAVWREDVQLEEEDTSPRSDEGLISLASMLHRTNSGHPQDLLALFRDLVKKYMQRTLSKADDMENAFAGVAGILEPLIGPAYHGIPERMFAEVIHGCWFWDTSLRRRAGFPSWSWTGWIYRREQSDVGIQPLSTTSKLGKLLAYYKVGASGVQLLGESGLAGHSGDEFLSGMDVDLRNHFIPTEQDIKSKNETFPHQEGISSGLIAFYTSIAYLRLRTPPGDFVGTTREYRVFHPHMNRQLTSIRLNVDYVAQKGTLLPFIVIDYDPDRRSFRLMLITLSGNRAERVNVTSQGRLVKEDDWKDANPKRELVFMS